LEEIYSLLINLNIVVHDFGYLVDEQGNLKLIDYDFLSYSSYWSDRDAKVSLETLKKQKFFLSKALGENWSSQLEEFQNHIENKIKKKMEPA